MAKIILAEDDGDMRRFLVKALQNAGYEVISFDNGLSAYQRLREEPFELLLTDIVMPEMDGIDTMRAIRRLPQFNQLPIIAVTAKAMKGDREKCIEAGAWDYLSKPVDTEQMLAVLRAWLHCPRSAGVAALTVEA